MGRLKPYLRWGIGAAAIAFLGRTLILHWAEVAALRLAPSGVLWLGLAFGVTLLAHSWAGWVWSWILQALQQPIGGRWSALVYLQTNLWKYLPGNVWHFYGRVRVLQGVGIAQGTAILAVVLEPVLMAIAALILGLASPNRYFLWQLALVGMVLALLQPRRLNPVVQYLSRQKASKAIPNPAVSTDAEDFVASANPVNLATQLPPDPLSSPSSPPPVLGLHRYPLKPLLGEMGFVLLRGIGFGLVVSAVTPLPATAWPRVISLFSLAWLAGLVVPGAPGGLGVFEAIAVALMQDILPVAGVLSAVALYRLVGTLAEAVGAGVAWLVKRYGGTVHSRPF